jgi:hypothetical protein
VFYFTSVIIRFLYLSNCIMLDWFPRLLNHLVFVWKDRSAFPTFTLHLLLELPWFIELVSNPPHGELWRHIRNAKLCWGRASGTDKNFCISRRAIYVVWVIFVSSKTFSKQHYTRSGHWQSISRGCKSDFCRCGYHIMSKMQATMARIAAHQNPHIRTKNAKEWELLRLSTPFSTMWWRQVQKKLTIRATM